MKKIRYGAFETNSSSTHAIVIPKEVDEKEYSIYDSFDHNYGFGREECRLCDNWDEKLAYVYILMENDSKEEKDKFKSRVMDVWEELSEEEYSPTPLDVFNYIDRDGCDGNLTGNDNFLILMVRSGNYVDQTCDLLVSDFIDRLKTDDEFLKRFIFNRESYITVGGDEYRGYNIKTIGFEYDYKIKGHYLNDEGEEPPQDWFDENDRIKEEYWDRYNEEYTNINSDFWIKLKEYEKENDVYLKGN